MCLTHYSRNARWADTRAMGFVVDVTRGVEGEGEGGWDTRTVSYTRFDRNKLKSFHAFYPKRKLQLLKAIYSIHIPYPKENTLLA